MRRWLLASLTLVLTATVAGCGSSGASDARQVTVRASDGTSVSLEIPKALPGPTTSTSAGFDRYEYVDAKHRRSVVFAIGAANGRSIATEMNDLLGTEPKPTSRQTSSPKINGASQAQLDVLEFSGTHGTLRASNLVATTQAGTLLELVTISLANDRGFDATAIINSIKLSHS